MYRVPRRSNSALGILKDQRVQTYGRMAKPFDLSFGSLDFQGALTYVKSAGFTDILTTEDGRIIFTGPADIIYRYSPRAAIEKQLNPFMNLLDEKQVRNFWELASRMLNPAVPIRFGTLQELMDGPYAPSVIPHPGKPDTNFYSVDRRLFFAGTETPFRVDLCSSVAGEKYSDSKGPVLLRTPAGYLVSVTHTVSNQDLDPIIGCRGLTWTSWAINQGLHDWPGSMTFYADVRILMRNLGFRKPSATRQKAVHFAAWDNWTLRVSKYNQLMVMLNDGMHNGTSGSGFIAAEYLAAGLDTTSFEVEDRYTLLDKKGGIPPIHTWDQADDTLRNLDRVRRGESQKTRFKEAAFDKGGYLEMKTEDLIPLSDIPLVILNVPRLADGSPGLTPSVVKAKLISAGFKGEFIEVQERDNMQAVDRAVELFARQNNRFITAAPSVTSGIISVKKEKVSADNLTKASFVQLPNGLIVSNIEVTQHLYLSVTGQDPSSFKGINNPVENVSWLDCIIFCNKLTDLTNKKFGYNRKKAYTIFGDNVEWDRSADGWRLPTEQEWVYAAKGDMKSFIPASLKVEDYAWVSSNSNASTHPVAEKLQNINNLYDIFGNVNEWCWTAEGSRRVICGGSWFNVASLARSGGRYDFTPDLRRNYLGFRVYRNGPGYTPIGD